MRSAYAAIAIAFVLIGCRGVIGIEDLQLTDGGATTPPGAETGADTGTDAFRPDAPLPPNDAGGDGAATGCATMGNDCRKCCRDSTVLKPQFMRLEQIAKMTGCVCGAGACTAASECGTALCTNSQPTMGCGVCVDDTFKPPSGSPECNTASNQCLGDATCRDALTCLRSCP